MYNKLKFILHYDGTTQGNTDRDAFKTVCDSELTNDHVYPIIMLETGHVLSSFCTLTDNIISGVIFYELTNESVADKDAFWSTLVTEKDKSTVVIAKLRAGTVSEKDTNFIDDVSIDK